MGDNSQVAWEDAPEWQRESAIKGVMYHVNNPDSKASDSHVSWSKEKAAAGWVFGPIKDPEKKTHPCLVPFEELPVEQQAKDYLFLAIVRSLEGGLSLLARKEDIKMLPRDLDVKMNKQLRKNLDKELQDLKALPASRERSLAITNIQQGIMWLGMDLKRLNEPNPYPNSRDSSNALIEPTADGLKL